MRGKTSPAELCLISPQGLLPPGASRLDPLLGSYFRWVRRWQGIECGHKLDLVNGMIKET